MGTPTIGGDTTGAVLEDSGAIISGNLDDIGTLTGDTDDIWSISSGAGYGTASINPTTGVWTYDLNDSNPFVDALDAGETLIDSFTVRMVDTSGIGNGQSDTQVVTITITGVPCLAHGSMIETGQGPCPINAIRPGDWVVTQNGLKEVRWIGQRYVTSDEMAANPRLCPIRILADALGNGLPERDLLVSRQHRMMVDSKIAARMFGSSEVLVPAIRLTEIPGVFIDEDIETVEYFHLLFDQHEIIYAEGAPTESLFTGPEALKAISDEAREEILTLVPEVAEQDYAPEPARFIPPARLLKQFVARHLKNSKPLLHPTV